MRGASRRQVVFALLAGAFTLLACLPAFHHRSWWIDELVTRDISRLPFYKPGFFGTNQPFSHSILGYTVQDPGPGPLMYLLDGIFSPRAYAMGGEFWLRVPGIAAGFAATVMFVLLLAPLAGSLPAVAVGCAFAAFPEFIDYYTGARGYGWLVLLAFVQWAACARVLHNAKSTGAAVVFVIASVAGVLVNPMHTLWTGCLCAAVLFSFRRSRAARKRLAQLVAVLCTAAGYLLWLGLWRAGMHAAHTGTAATVNAPFVFGAALRKAAQSWNIVGLLIVNGMLAAVLWWRGNSVARLHALVSTFATLGGAVLLVVLSGKFFAVPRYFYALYVCAMISSAFVLRLVMVRMRRHVDGRLAARVLVACGVLLAIAQLPFAHWRARTPVHNWWDAAEFLRLHSSPGEFVVTGPNSEFEVYRVYAQAGKVPAQAPLLIEDAARRQHPLDRANGLELLLNRGKTVWLATAAAGQHRTPEYWSLVNRNFQVVAQIPGRADILIMRSRGQASPPTR
jgi:hypothetical protein